MTGSRFDALRALARRAGHGEVDTVEDADGEKIAIEAYRRRGRRRGRIYAAGGAFAIAATIALVLATRGSAPVSAAFDVEGAASVERGYVTAPETASASLKFADGSVVHLAPRARVRVAREPGVVIALEDGAVEVDRPSAPRLLLAFRIDAGPSSIEPAPGCVATASWSASARRAEVAITQGGASIVGGPVRERLTVSAGQRAVVELASNSFSIGALVASASPSTVSSDLGASEPQVNGIAPPASTIASPAARGVISPSTWSQRVARGEFAGVVADAEARGIDGVLARQPLADLVALADAARFSGRRDLARRAFAAQRERFPSSAEAHAAAFHLGRLAEDSSGAAAALPFYDLYLAEAPDGPFAAEALGRKMVALSRSGRTDAARAAAVEYRARHPNGAHAAIARELGGH